MIPANSQFDIDYTNGIFYFNDGVNIVKQEVEEEAILSSLGYEIKGGKIYIEADANPFTGTDAQEIEHDLEVDPWIFTDIDLLEYLKNEF